MPDDDLIVCRCEDATLAELAGALERDPLNVTQVKHRTRAGMGMCAGRTCRPLLARVLPEAEHAVPFTHRLPARPLTAAEIARTPLPEDDPSPAAAPETPTAPDQEHR